VLSSGYRWPQALKKARDMAGLAWACHEIGGIESVRVPFETSGCGIFPLTPLENLKAYMGCIVGSKAEE